MDNVSLVAPPVGLGRSGAARPGCCFAARTLTSRPVHCRVASSFGAALAMMVLAEPTPRLLMLDEPTNNLDLSALAALTQALAGFEGALVIASHDVAFLREIGATRWLELSADGLAEVDLR